MRDLRTSNTITIKAPQHEVWRALTTPELIKEWFFGVDTETDWNVGSPLVHRGVWQGKAYEDKGKIVRISPPDVLVHTHWSPLSGLPDQPESYQEVTWTLASRGVATDLTVAEENLPSAEARAVSEKAWATVLGNLKRVLERTDALPKTA